MKCVVLVVIGLLVLIGVAVPIVASASPVHESDHRTHIVASIAPAAFGSALADMNGYDSKTKFLVGVVIGLLPGIVKEVNDDHFDNTDLFADFCGAVIGAGTITLITFDF